MLLISFDQILSKNKFWSIHAMKFWIIENVGVKLEHLDIKYILCGSGIWTQVSSTTNWYSNC